VMPSQVRPIGDDVLAGLMSDIAAEMVGLGVRERDETILGQIATALVELNIDSSQVRTESEKKYAE